jgi:integrase/recombinase XerD
MRTTEEEVPVLTSSPLREKKTLVLPDEDVRLLRSFLINLEAENLSPDTIHLRRMALRRCLSHLRDDMGITASLRKVTTDHLREVQAVLLRNSQPATVQSYVMALKRFFRFLQEEGERQDNPAERLKAPRQQVKVKQPLTPPEVKALLKACEADRSLLGARDRAVLTLLLDTGMRAGEVCALNVEDVDFDQRHVLVRRGKGGNGRVVGLSAETLKTVDRYLRRRKAEEGEALFVARDGKRLTGMGMYFIVDRRAREAGLERHIHPHLLRHTAATWLANAGVQEGELRALMGWSPSSDMVYRYTASTLAHRAREAQRRANILNAILA